MNANATATLTDRIAGLLFEVEAFESSPATELTLAGALGVSRTPVREALRDLEKDGLIARRKNRGVWLKTPSVADIVEAYDVRSVMEGFACRLAAERITDADIKRLQTFADRCEQAFARGDFRRQRDADVAFHDRIVEIGGNTLIARLMSTFHILKRTFEAIWLEQGRPTRRKSPYSHQRIIDTLKNGDPDACERIARNHVQFAKQSLLDAAPCGDDARRIMCDE